MRVGTHRLGRIIMRTAWCGVVGVIGGLFLLLLANVIVVHLTAGRVRNGVGDVPEAPVALVLGAGPGSWFLNNRVVAAAQLYHTGRVRHLLVSGDNRVRNYNEPFAMKRSLIRLGVPADAITCDYAGIRTLDSVARARAVFGQTRLIIVSQEFHNYRALFLARAAGIDAWAVNAAPPPEGRFTTAELREIPARMLAVADVVFGRKPRFGGPPEPIQIEPPQKASLRKPVGGQTSRVEPSANAGES